MANKSFPPRRTKRGILKHSLISLMYSICCFIVLMVIVIIISSLFVEFREQPDKFRRHNEKSILDAIKSGNFTEVNTKFEEFETRNL